MVVKCDGLRTERKIKPTEIIVIRIWFTNRIRREDAGPRIEGNVSVI